MTAILGFLGNEVPVFGGYVYSDFGDKLRVILPRLKLHVNNLKTRAEVLQWYLDLNTGGVVHTSAEIEKVQRLLTEEINAVGSNHAPHSHQR